MTEILQALKLGCYLVKVFPGRVGGPSFIKDVRGHIHGLSSCLWEGLSLQERMYLRELRPAQARSEWVRD